jgi:hypothetical protein
MALDAGDVSSSLLSFLRKPPASAPSIPRYCQELNPSNFVIHTAKHFLNILKELPKELLNELSKASWELISLRKPLDYLRDVGSNPISSHASRPLELSSPLTCREDLHSTEYPTCHRDEPSRLRPASSRFHPQSFAVLRHSNS